MDTIQSEISTKKELGQFFSGRPVAKLLVALARCKDARNVIDPMCGTGDMLAAYVSSDPGIDPDVSILSGIEIDKHIYTHAANRLKKYSNIQLICGNAFSTDTMKLLSVKGYDLVITNPPYVRRQTANTADTDQVGTLNIDQIRKSLLRFLTGVQTIDRQEKEVFSTLIRNFSGLADLAIPAWILCALLVKEGGKIAMVLPEAWLSREYALIIQYLLLRFFQLEYIVEDANATWFKTAQVKTVLLVARRIKAKKSISDWLDETFTHVTLYAGATTDESLTGNIFPESDAPECEFVDAIGHGLSREKYFRTRRNSLKAFAAGLTAQAAMLKWYKSGEPGILSERMPGAMIKSGSELRVWFEGATVSCMRLHEMGISIGQGLRTGANRFFYMDYMQVNDDQIIVHPDNMFHLPAFRVGRRYFRKVLRKQSELDERYSLARFESKGVVLALQAYALPEDVAFVRACSERFDHAYASVPDELGQYIRVACSARNGDAASDRLIPDLTAVEPNIKKWNPEKPEEAPRFWYMLPEFSKRHLPDLFIPRINNGIVKTRLNEGGYLIDANFSSLWAQNSDSPYNSYFLLALLNSTYAVTAMEEYGTVMGGGALKLEATQLKQIPLPVLETDIIAHLIELGQRLSTAIDGAKDLICQIDLSLLTAIGFGLTPIEKLDQLKLIKEQMVNKRKSK